MINAVSNLKSLLQQLLLRHVINFSLACIYCLFLPLDGDVEKLIQATVSSFPAFGDLDFIMLKVRFPVVTNLLRLGVQ